MPVIKGLEGTFDTVATIYEKLRPGYTDELYRMLFKYIAIDNSSHVVEVGIGGGQATLPILKTGCILTAVEYGQNFSKLCEKKFEGYKNFSVITRSLKMFLSLILNMTWFTLRLRSTGYRKILDIQKFMIC